MPDETWEDIIDEATGNADATAIPGDPQGPQAELERAQAAAAYLRQNADLQREVAESMRGQILADAAAEAEQRAAEEEIRQAWKEGQELGDWSAYGALRARHDAAQAQRTQAEQAAASIGDARVGEVLEGLFQREFGANIYDQLSEEALDELQRQPNESPQEHYARATSLVRAWQGGEVEVAAGATLSGGNDQSGGDRGSASSAFSDLRSEISAETQRSD